MTSVITQIVVARVGARVRIIELDDAPWRTTSAATIRILGLAQGDVVVREQLRSAVDEAERKACRERALAILAYRERSTAEMRSKLVSDGYPDTLVDDIVAAFVNAGLVDDVRFADAFVRTAMHARSLGRRRTERELAERGVADEIATEALDRHMPVDQEAERARALAFRLARRNERVDRLAARLARKGFALGVAFDAAREVVSSSSPDDGHVDMGDLP